MILKCSPGNKKCGKRCIPVEYFCKEGMTGGVSRAEGIADTARNLSNNGIKLGDLKPVKESELQYGDVVITPLSIGNNEKHKNFIHYAVYVGNNTVIQLGPDAKNKKGEIRTSDFDAKTWQKMRPVLPNKKRDVAEIKKTIDTLYKAQSEGKTEITYNMVLSNCERFANLVTYGVPYSSQYDELGHGAKLFSKGLSEKIFKGWKGKSLNEVFARTLRYKDGGGIQQVPALTSEEIIEGLVDFSEVDIRAQYDSIMKNIGDAVNPETEMAKFDELLQFLNLITMMYIAAQQQEGENVDN
jgi:hypothetical protein